MQSKSNATGILFMHTEVTQWWVQSGCKNV